MNVQPKREGFVDPEEQAQVQAAPEQEIDAKPPPAPVEEWPIRLKLMHKPVRNNRDELVHELTFRQPTAGDINRYGNPVRIDFNGEVQIDDQKMMRVIAALTGILVPNLEAMDPRDWTSCAYRLRSFFLPDLAGW
jgi:tail assembly chaperone E/41/14-like protein